MFDSFKKIYYSGKEGDIVQIPCKLKGNITQRHDRLITAIGGKDGWNKDRNGYIPANYFGLHPIKDASERTIKDGYEATYEGSGTFNVKERTSYYQECLSLEIFVGCSEDVANNPKSNVNKWLKAISWTPRSSGFWILSIILCPAVVGIPLLVGCFYRLVMRMVAKQYLKKAKKAFKKNGKIVVF